MRRQHQPKSLWQALHRLEKMYAQRFLLPQFDDTGEGCTFTNPRHIHVMGPRVTLGKHVHIAALPDNQVRLACWPLTPDTGRLHIGDYTVVNPGVRISAGVSITLGTNTILASNVYMTDADWHGKYDRVFSHGVAAPIVIEDNVWLSEGVVVGRGVTIGENSIVGAGSIVVKDIPKNVVAAGNPARVVAELDPNERWFSRSGVLGDAERYYAGLRELEAEILKGNTWRGWLRALLSPTRDD